MQGNDGYLYLFIDEQTPYIWKKVQIGVKAVGNILQSTKCTTKIFISSLHLKIMMAYLVRNQYSFQLDS